MTDIEYEEYIDKIFERDKEYLDILYNDENLGEYLI